MSEETQITCEKAETSGKSEEPPVCGLENVFAGIELGGHKNERKTVDKKPNVKVLFWNVNSLRPRYKSDIDEFLRRFDVICLLETWVRENEWGEWKEKLESIGEYTWIPHHAQGNPIRRIGGGGMVMGIKEGIIIEEDGGSFHANAMKQTIKIGESKWDIVTVHIQDYDEKKPSRHLITDVFKFVEERCRNDNVLIGGDFNARTGTSQSDFRLVRMSEDSIQNTMGTTLIRELNKRGYVILNGCTVGDEVGRYTCTFRRPGTVIDYGIVNNNSKSKISKFLVELSGTSDHRPLVVEIKQE